MVRRTRREGERAYMACGAIIGVPIPIVGLLAVAAFVGYRVGLPGAPGGSVTGRAGRSAARKPR